MEDMKVLRGLDRPMSPDERYSCPRPFPSHQREESSLWFHRRPNQKTLTNLQVWWVQQKWTTRQQWRVRQMLWTAQQVTAQQVTAQQMTGQQVTGQQGGPSWSRMTSQKSWMIQQKLPIQHTIRSQQGRPSTWWWQPGWCGQPSTPAVDGPAVVDEPVAYGTPAGSTPAAAQDSSMLLDVSSLLFPSLPRAINQTTLIDFMSMWTLMQCRMDLGMAVPYAQARPASQTTAPTPRDDDTPPKRSKTSPRTPDRRPRTPVRRSRTPVRRARVMDDTRDFTRSRSPIRRSSSSESPPRDASPVNFSAALDSEDKVKDRFVTDDEDGDGSQKKVLAAQYQLFRQAVMSSKGSFKVNPAKSRRASRASLLDLGDSEVTDRVSWLDQPSLMDTMASTARIAQGLKEDEELEKTKLSETLNTSSSTFKHLTVKQIFPREPYRLKIHRDAQYVPKPPGENGLSDTKAPTSYQMSHRMCLDMEELARRSASPAAKPWK